METIERDASGFVFKGREVRVLGDQGYITEHYFNAYSPFLRETVEFSNITGARWWLKLARDTHMARGARSRVGR